MDLCIALWAQLTERLKEQPKLLEMLDRLKTLLEKPIARNWYVLWAKVFGFYDLNLKS